SIRRVDYWVVDCKSHQFQGRQARHCTFGARVECDVCAQNFVRVLGRALRWRRFALHAQNAQAGSTPWAQLLPRQAPRHEWERMGSLRLFVLLSVCSYHNKLIHSRFCSPYFAWPAQNLTDLRGRAGQFKNGKRFKRWVEAHEGVRAEVTQDRKS